MIAPLVSPAIPPGVLHLDSSDLLFLSVSIVIAIVATVSLIVLAVREQ
jgi:hypothetical protein